MQDIHIDSEGSVRFKANRIVRTLLDTGRLDMNALSLMDFTNEDREQFAQLIGYSVSGFGTLSYANPETVRKADKRADKLLKDVK